jgi:hypothetical protein
MKNRLPQIKVGAYYTIEPKHSRKFIYSGILLEQISNNDYGFINVYYTRYNNLNAVTKPINTPLIFNTNDYIFKLILEPSFCKQLLK